MAVLLLVGASVLRPAPCVRAAEVRFPIALDDALIQEAVRTSLTSARALDGGDGCHSVRIDDVRVDRAGDRLRISTRGSARAGFPFFRFCLFPLTWNGYLDAVATPDVGADWQLRFRDVSSEILDRNHARTTVGSRVWDLVKPSYDRRLAGVAFDVRPPVDEVRALLRSSVPAGRAAPVLAALDSLRTTGTTVDDEGVKVGLALDVPEPPQGAPSGPEPPLQPIELERWQATLESFDGFLVFVIKDLGVLSTDSRLRDDLFDVLMTSREHLLAALTGEQPGTADPVREVFAVSWERLRAAVRGAAARGDLGDRAVRYAAFLAAGDALTALDAVGPWLGLEISADGLRRLARLLEPDYAGDPIAYSEAPDPALRELFHFHDPDVPDVPDVPADAEQPGAWWWPGPRAAWAEPPDELAAIVKKLDRFVPSDSELGGYRDAVAGLLDQVAKRAAQTNSVEPRFLTLYGHLVRAVAWQESCWRQFVRKNGKVTFLLSSTGDIGIMQVNRRVWRGFFNLQKLEWNVGYNAGAGAEILGQLLTRVGVREADVQVDNAARATYSAYNAGPGSYHRYRDPRAPRRQRAIDQAFWEKYQATAAGKALDYVLCVETWGAGGATRLSTASPPPGALPCRKSRSALATPTRPSRHAAIASRPRASCV